MFAKQGISAGNKILQPTPERFFLSCISLLVFEASSIYGAAGNLYMKNLLLSVCDLCQAGIFQKKFCLFSRDYWDFNEEAPFLPHAICGNMLEICWTARKLCSLCKCRYCSCLPWLSGMLGIRKKKEMGGEETARLGSWTWIESMENGTRNREYNLGLRLHICTRRSESKLIRQP